MGGASVGAAVRFSFQTRPNARPPLLPIRERGETKRVSRGSRGSEVPMWWPWPRGPGFSEGSAPRPPCFLTEDPRPGITVMAPHRPVTWSGRRVTAQLGFVCTAAAPVPPTSRARSPHIPSTASVSCRRLPRCPLGSCWGSGSRPPRGKSGIWGRTAGPRERGPRAQARGPCRRGRQAEGRRSRAAPHRVCSPAWVARWPADQLSPRIQGLQGASLGLG